MSGEARRHVKRVGNEGSIRGNAAQEGRLAEYVALRAEILKRIEIRHQLCAIALTIAGALLGAGVAAGNATVVLILPLLIPFIALAWAHNDLRVAQIANHIREEIELKTPGITWELRLDAKRKGLYGERLWRGSVVAYAGVFLFIQAVALAIGSLACEMAPATRPLLVVGGMAMAAVFVIMASSLLRFSRAENATIRHSTESPKEEMSSMRRRLTWLKYVPSLVIAAVAIASLVVSLRNTSRVAMLSVEHTAATIRSRFTLDCDAQLRPVAKVPFSVSGFCEGSLPDGYRLWVVAVAGDRFYPMHPEIELGDDGRWIHTNVRVDTPGLWTVAVVVADSDVTMMWRGRSGGSEFLGADELPSGAHTIRSCYGINVAPASQP